MIAAGDEPTVPLEADRHPDILTRETIARWSGVACLYVGTAAALAFLWSPT